MLKMPSQNSNIQLAKQGFGIIQTGFDNFCDRFAAITQRARRRFESRDWHGMRRDTVERLDLYSKIVDETVTMMHSELKSAVQRTRLWTVIRSQFIDSCQHRRNAEIACTFYNSVNRKILTPLGIDPLLTFIEKPPIEVLNETTDLYFTIEVKRITPKIVTSILNHYEFRSPFVSMKEDSRRCAVRIGHLTDHMGAHQGALRLEMLKEPFFRGMSTYLVGRLRRGQRQSPIIFVLDNEPSGILVHALLTTIDEMRILFSFSRAYFHVKVQNPGSIVAFLNRLMPQKRIAELYIGLGYHKHGKTELYRDLLRHQQVCSQDRFDYSPGKHGMVMITFNMPGDDLIYKLIRDRFDSPKRTTHRKVKEKYDYVFRHDRAGRLLDVQTFENLKLEDCCFTPELLSEISIDATKAALVKDGEVQLLHTYVERRITPLNLFLQLSTPEVAEAAVIDYGRAIKDLARVNVFPGDMLIKNFGVTEMGRVLFYDYDELCPLLECNFRKLPRSRHYEDELSDEPWFSVGEHDVFPEEFSAFLGMSTHLRQVFLKYHQDLFETEFWLQTQAQIRANKLPHIRPYGKAQMLKPTSDSHRNN
jgi:isocitrate dehydrogenase kinase/phosphatase